MKGSRAEAQSTQRQRKLTSAPSAALREPSGSGEPPKGWVTASLSELLTTLESGSRPRGGVRGVAEGVPSIGGEHLNYNGGFNLDSVKYVPTDFAAAMTKGRIQRQDILLVKDGATTGKTAFVGEDFPFPDAVVNEHVFICRPGKQIEPRFLFRFLTSKNGQERILENFKGSAQGGINQTFAPNTEVPLAPLAEQRRIVAKLETLLGKVDACQQRLAKLPVLLKRFRQSVLAAACSGRLTADWREENGGGIYEATTVEAIAEYVGGYAYKSPTFLEIGKHQVIRIGNVRPFALNLEASPVFIPDDIATDTERFKLKAGDIVISMTGTKYKRDYGCAGIVRETNGLVPKKRTVKSDIWLSIDEFECGRGKEIKGAMQAFAIIERLDVVEDGGPSLLVGGEVTSVNQFQFEGAPD